MENERDRCILCKTVGERRGVEDRQTSTMLPASMILFGFVLNYSRLNLLERNGIKARV